MLCSLLWFHSQNWYIFFFFFHFATLKHSSSVTMAAFIHRNHIHWDIPGNNCQCQVWVSFCPQDKCISFKCWFVAQLLSVVPFRGHKVSRMLETQLKRQEEMKAKSFEMEVKRWMPCSAGAAADLIARRRSSRHHVLSLFSFFFKLFFVLLLF